MAAPHNLSANADSLEKQFYELALTLFEAEQNVPEDNRPDNIQIAFDTEASQVQITATLDVKAISENASIKFDAVNYLA